VNCGRTLRPERKETAMSIRNCALAVALCALLFGPCRAAPAAGPQEGTDFRMLTPAQPTSSGGKIEVTEFFSYGCPHCNEFYPLLTTWLARQPQDVVLLRVPVGFNRPQWINLQRAYYALQASGDLARLDGALFDAIHEKRRQLFDEQSLADWVGANGGSSEKFTSAYTSFGVNNQTVQADTMAEHYQVIGVPSMAVNGEYVALGDTLAAILDNTDKLIAKVRAERAAAKHPAKHP
jgi:protein dithiol oxidoreductase (disulfide-forming)